MRFLFITGNYKPAVSAGGPVNTVSQLAEHLVGLGHRVCVLALNEDDGRPMDVPVRTPTEIEGVEVWYFTAQNPLWRRWSGRVSGWRQWERGVFAWLHEKVGEFDVLHLHIGLLHPARLAARLALKHGKVLCYHQRGNLDPRRFGRFGLLKRCYLRLVETPVLNAASVLFALSEREADVYRMWTSNETIVSLPNGVDFESWRKPETLLKLPDGLKIGKGPVILWSARWDYRKGPLEFIEMVETLRPKLPAATFLMVGPESGDSVYQAVKLRSAQVPDLQILRGLPENERKAILHRADYFILPTHGEGFSVGILEAMAAETVVITTPEANFPELEQDHAGCLCRRDPAAMAQRLLSIENSPEDRRKLAQRASQYVKENYSWDRIAEEYAAAVQR